MKERVAITGIGVVSPIGNSVEQLLSSLQEGKSGIVSVRELQLEPAHRFLASMIGEFIEKAQSEALCREDFKGGDCTRFFDFLRTYLEEQYFTSMPAAKVRYVGMVTDFSPEAYLSPKEINKTDRVQQMAAAASEMARQDAGFGSLLSDHYRSERIAVIAGSSMGGMSTMEDGHLGYLTRGPAAISPYFLIKLMADMGAGEISRRQGANGPIEAPSGACATGGMAVGRAFELIRNGTVDAAFAAASEAGLTNMGLGGFEAVRALSTRDYGDPRKASRPFDRERSGFIMAEGATCLVLENLEKAKKRGARIYAEVTGFGIFSDAYHPTRPDPEGKYAALAMSHALKTGRVNRDEVGYINAHGTSTLLNDKVETMAVKSVFGCERANKIPVSSTKSLSGHMMAAAGAFEVAICALALRHQFLPPTINYEYPDPDCDLADYVPNHAREAKFKVALSNSFGFGGRNASVALRYFF